MHGSREKGHLEIRHHWNTSRKYKDKIVGKAYLYHHVLHSQPKRAREGSGLVAVRGPRNPKLWEKSEEEIILSVTQQQRMKDCGRLLVK